MIKCSQCGRKLGREGEHTPVASISGGIMGDEYIESYFFCSHCEVYTIEVYHDRFSGEDEIGVRGPISKGDGDAKVELIRKCSQPWNKKCRCEAHRTYFGSWLD